MILKRFLFSLHICIVLLATILVVCTAIGIENYQYIYIISLVKITQYRFDTFIFATFCAGVLMIIDIIYVIIHFINYLFCIQKKDNNIELIKKIICNIIMAIVMFISLLIYFNQYIIFLV